MNQPSTNLRVLVEPKGNSSFSFSFSFKNRIVVLYYICSLPINCWFLSPVFPQEEQVQQSGTFFSVFSSMVQTAVSDGKNPVAFRMNTRTLARVKRDIENLVSQTIPRTIWDKLADWFRPKNPKTLILHGLPVIQTNFLPDGNIVLETAPQEVPMGKGSHNTPQDAPPPPDAQDNPFESMADDAQFAVTAADDLPPTLNDLSTGKEKVSPTDVLIKAMDGVDNLSGVVVVRVHRSGDIDMCLSCNQFEAQGILQKAQYWLAINGGR